MQSALTEYMPLAMPVSVVESQRKVLEQLHYLTTFRNQMVILAGPDGAGKSTLLEVFLEQASDYANLAYLATPQKLNVEQIRQRLLQQITTVMRMPADVSLSKSIRRALPSEPQHLMLVIDDAEQLPPIILDELQELVLHSRFTAGRHRISVIVSGKTEWAARQKKRLPSNQSDAPEILVIPEFSDTEALQFAKGLLSGHQKGKALAADTYRIQAALGTSLSYPGTIRDCLQALVAPIPSTRYHVEDETQPTPASKPSKARVKSAAKTPIQLKIALVGAILMTLVLSAWMYREQLEVALTQYLSGVNEVSEVVAEEPPTTEEQSSAEQAEPATAVSADLQPEDFLNPVLERGDSQLTMNFDEALPRLTEAARNFEQKGDLYIGLYRFEDRSTPAEAVNVEVVTPNPEPMQAELTTATETTTQEPTPNPWLSAQDNAVILDQDAERVALQLAAFSSESATQQFLATQSNRDNLMVYHTLRNGGDWFVVITGNYSSLREARQAITNLPSNQQGLSPWAKPYEWIHRELAVVDLIASN